MTTTTALVILLVLSAAANIAGIVRTQTDNPFRVDKDGMPFVDPPKTWWRRSRANIFMGFGLALNTAAGFVAVFTAAAPAA